MVVDRERRGELAPVGRKIVLARADAISFVALIRIPQTLQKLGYQIAILGWDRSSDDISSLELPDSQQQFLRMRIGYSNWKVLPGLLLWGVWCFWKLVRSKADAVHAIDLEAALPAAIASLYTRCPLVFHVRDTYYLRHQYPGPVHWLIKTIEGWVMARAKHIIHVDESRIGALEQRFLQKTTVIYNSSPEIAMPDVAEVTKNGHLKILASGYLRFDRGMEWVLDTVKNLPETQVLAIGMVSEPELERMLLDHPQVLRYPFLPQADFLRMSSSADVSVAFYEPKSPLYRLASASKVFDSMMLGQPVIVNEETPMARLVKETDCGYVVPYGDPGALLAVLRHIQANKPEAVRKGQHGRQAFVRRFSWQVMEERLDELYRRVWHENDLH